MALTPEQKAERRKYIGSSDAAIIMGVSPFEKTQLDLWLEKTGRLELKDEEEAEHFERGRILEPALISFAIERTGAMVVRRDVMAVAANGIMAANFDAAFDDLKKLCEAKSTNLADGWGDESDEIPDHVMVQCQHQMRVDPSFVATVIPVIMPKFKRLNLALYETAQHKSLGDMIEDSVCDWWRKHVVADIAPEGSGSERFLKNRMRAAGKRRRIDTADVEQWRKLLEVEKEAKKAADKLKEKIITALGDAEIGECDVGEVKYTQVTRAGYEVKASTYRKASFKAYKQEESE